MRVGLVLNPIAGMGGSVGLKGTDGAEILAESIKRGARPIAKERALEALRAAAPLENYDFLAAEGDMGGELLRKLEIDFETVHVPSAPTTALDTLSACSQMIRRGVDIILFAGGDGTARDVMQAVGQMVPVIGIPSGVKMHSGVFATNPRNAGTLLMRFSNSWVPAHPAEVVDIDEDAFREGRLNSTLRGHLLTPYEPSLTHPSKSDIAAESAEDQMDEIGRYVSEGIEPGVLCCLGPGGTVRAVASAIGVEKTLLGVDAVLDKDLVAKDANESDLLALLESYPKARIVVSPIGAHGFIFGRGSQQISPSVIRRVGVRNIEVIATRTKLNETKVLRVDTGDAKLDEELRGFRRVIVAYGRQLMILVR